MENLSTSTQSASSGPTARFLRTVGTACLDLARELETGADQPQSPRSIEQVGLGSLQLQVAHGLTAATDAGLSPRQLTDLIGRSDEPNVRTALHALEKRGVAERLPGSGPQRWRLTLTYRPARGVGP